MDYVASQFSPLPALNERSLVLVTKLFIAFSNDLCLGILIVSKSFVKCECSCV